MIHRSPLQAWSLPLLVHPSPDEAPNLVAVVFEYMKRMPAQFCIERALNPLSRQVLAADGVFRADPEDSAHKASLVLSRRDEVVFVETSSGNMALGLAEACKQSGVALHLLLPASVDTVTKDAIVELGAVVEGIDTSDQQVRIQRLDKIRTEYESQGWTTVSRFIVRSDFPDCIHGEDVVDAVTESFVNQGVPATGRCTSVAACLDYVTETSQDDELLGGVTGLDRSIRRGGEAGTAMSTSPPPLHIPRKASTVGHGLSSARSVA